MNYSLAYGFVEFSVGVPLLLLLVWHLGRGERASRTNLGLAVWAGGVAVLLLFAFFAHAILCIFCLCVVGLYAVLAFAKARSLSVAAALGVVPAVAAVGVWKLSRKESTGGPGWLIYYYKSQFLPEYPRRLADVLSIDHDSLISPQIGPWLAAAFGVLTVGAAVACLAGRRRGAVEADAPPRTAILALLGAAAAVVLLAPPGYPPFWSVYQRFTFVLMIALALWGGAAAGRGFAPRGLVYLLALANVALGLLWAEHVAGFGPTARDLVALSRDAHPAGFGAYVVADTAYRGEAEALVHTANLATAFGHLPAQSELYDFPFARVRRGPGMSEPIPKESANYASVTALLPDLDAFGWVLVHAGVGDLDRAMLERPRHAHRRTRRLDHVRGTARRLIRGERHLSPGRLLVPISAVACTSWGSSASPGAVWPTSRLTTLRSPLVSSTTAEASSMRLRPLARTAARTSSGLIRSRTIVSFNISPRQTKIVGTLLTTALAQPKRAHDQATIHWRPMSVTNAVMPVTSELLLLSSVLARMLPKATVTTRSKAFIFDSVRLPPIRSVVTNAA